MEASFCVVGADGLIGVALRQALKDRDLACVATTRRPERAAGEMRLLDLTDERAVSGFSAQADVAFLCAATTNMLACERDREGTRRVNVTAAATLARRLWDAGAHIVLLSTNAVFDGSRPFPGPTTPVAPANAYGRQKAEAEAAITALGNRYTIVRMTKVLGPNLPLIRGWCENLRQGNPIRPFADLSMAPLSLPYVVRALQRIGEHRQEGILHLSGENDLSYAEFATLIATRLGVQSGLVQPTTAADAGVELPPAPRATALGQGAAETALGLRVQAAKEVARDLVEALHLT